MHCCKCDIGRELMFVIITSNTNQFFELLIYLMRVKFYQFVSISKGK